MMFGNLASNCPGHRSNYTSRSASGSAEASRDVSIRTHHRDRRRDGRGHECPPEGASLRVLGMHRQSLTFVTQQARSDASGVIVVVRLAK